jgi:tetratricopeptide (TPR) repeat protein
MVTLVLVLSALGCGGKDVFTPTPAYEKPAWRNAGDFMKKGQFEDAIQEYTKAIQQKPDYAEYYENRGLAYQALGEHQAAIDDFDKAYQLTRGVAGAHDDEADILSNRGSSYQGLGQYRRAIQDYDIAIQLNPKYAGLYYKNRSIAFAAIGQLDLATQDAMKACEMDRIAC